MPTRIRIIPYKQGSRSAATLAAALGGRRIRLRNSRFIPRYNDVLINWGNSNPPASIATAHGDYDCLNDPNAVRRASNKLSFFQLMPEGLAPEFWTNAADIPEQAFREGSIVVCRTVLNGHSGRGIHLARSRADLVDAPLYVAYVKKQEEYRIHVGRLPNGDTSIISAQRKARRTDVPDADVNWQIRNHSTGFVFVRNNVNPPADVLRVAREAFEATGLDFGAADVIWNDRQQRAYVLEINTAPGLEGQTVTDYVSFFQGYIN